MIPMEQAQAQVKVSDASEADGRLTSRHIILFVSLCFLPFILAWDSMRLVVSAALGDSTYTHIPLIPLVTAFLIYVGRRAIFSHISYGWANGFGFLVPGAIMVVAARLNLFHLQLANQLSLVVSGLILMWIAAFALSWGADAFRAARFPLSFLIFMVPIPEPLLSKFVYLLQVWSANASTVFFNLFGVPFLREDLVFSLPGIAIRVAEECSGIRSTLALLIMTVLASHLFLKATWKQVLVCLLVIPLSIIKNGLRIATLSALAVYVDPIFLNGPIHHQFGGMLFFGAAFIPLAIIFRYFQKTERSVPTCQIPTR